jgi:regulatory protein
MARKFEGFDPQRADERQKRRVISYFQRRGFSIAAILRVFRDRGE